jgi:hypothetical protein
MQNVFMLSVANKPFMLSVANKPFMLSVFLLNIVMLSVANKSFMLNVFMLNVEAPDVMLNFCYEYNLKNSSKYCVFWRGLGKLIN